MKKFTVTQFAKFITEVTGKTFTRMGVYKQIYQNRLPKGARVVEGVGGLEIHVNLDKFKKAGWSKGERR